ncbi:MAG: hypothetical protein Q4G70_12700, partial [Pseudomonadota bacterium]|nr:hypothetical protein [Pseudomonadota bacterium]
SLIFFGYTGPVGRVGLLNKHCFDLKWKLEAPHPFDHAGPAWIPQAGPVHQRQFAAMTGLSVS